VIEGHRGETHPGVAEKVGEIVRRVAADRAGSHGKGLAVAILAMLEGTVQVPRLDAESEGVNRVIRFR